MVETLLLSYLGLTYLIGGYQALNDFIDREYLLEIKEIEGSKWTLYLYLGLYFIGSPLFVPLYEIAKYGNRD